MQQAELCSRGTFPSAACNVQAGPAGCWREQAQCKATLLHELLISSSLKRIFKIKKKSKATWPHLSCLFLQLSYLLLHPQTLQQFCSML